MHQPATSAFARARSYFAEPGGGLWRADVIAGLTTAAVVVPKTMAFAAIAGLPAEAGLYAAFAPMLAYAVLGGSRVLSVSSTSTIAILTAAALSQVARGAGEAELLTAAVTLSLLVGAALVIASALRLGFVANFISDPVLTGFKAGVGLLIIVDQLPKLLGVHLDKSGFFRAIGHLAQAAPDASWPTLLLALATLALIFALERFAPRAPAPLLAVIAGVAASAFLGLSEAGVAVVGQIRAGLPSLHLPDLALVAMLWPAALGIALMSFTESIATGRAFAAPGEARPRPDRELAALGAANLLGGLTAAMPAGGGASQTAVNARAGAKTKMAAVATAAVVLAVLLVLAPAVALLPLASLAAVVVATTLPLIDPREFQTIAAVRRTECYLALVAVAGVVLLGSLNGILAAIAVSVLMLIYHANHPAVHVLARKPGTEVFRPTSIDHPLDETHPGLLILRTEGRMHFANAQRVGDKMWPLIHDMKPQVVLLDCSGVPDVEYTALRMLIDAEVKLRKAGVSLWLAGLSPTALQVVNRSALGRTLGRERMFFDVPTAVAAWRTAHPDQAPTHALAQSNTAGSLA